MQSLPLMDMIEADKRNNNYHHGDEAMCRHCPSLVTRPPALGATSGIAIYQADEVILRLAWQPKRVR